MKKMTLLIIVVVGLCNVVLLGCSGVRKNSDTYSVHAESFNLLFLRIPGGDTQARALKLAPEGSEIITIKSSPDDLSSFAGVLNRIIGIDTTTISGKMKK